MSNELVVSNNNFPSMNELQSIQLIARTANASGLYGAVGGEPKILMILLAARELGVPPCMALNGGIWNIQGRIEVSPRCMNSMIRRAGHSIKVVRSDDQICTLLGKRSDGDSFECSFSIEDAQKAGLASKDVWKKYTSDMLYNRCMSRLARRLFADVIGEAYIQGEVKEAKEVEVQEKNLQQAECEDVTNMSQDKVDTNLCHNEPPKPPVEPPKELMCNQEEFDELSKLYSQVDVKTRENVDNNLMKIKAAPWMNIPKKHFILFKNGMENNIKSREVANENK